MQHRHSSRIANRTAALSCLLAVTWLLSGPVQARAATPTADQINKSSVLADSSGKPSGQTPLEVLDGRATRASHYEPSRMLRLAIVLTPPHLAEEKQFLDDIQNKQSPLFHQFLTAEEWNARFSPSVEDEQAVVDWAQSQGLTITQRYPNRLLVDVEAQAGIIEKALNVTINIYQLPAHGQDEARTVFSNDRDPVLPSRFDGVVDSVQGLNSILVMRPGGGRGRVEPPPDYVPGPVIQEGGSAEKNAARRDAPLDADEGYMSPEGGVKPPPSGYWTPAALFSSSAYDYQAL